MTDREICKLIADQGSCSTPEFISCGLCPLNKAGKWNCENFDKSSEAAKQWLDDHTEDDVIKENVENIWGDNINHPSHYKQGDIECIDAIKSALTEDEFRGYIKGNVLKYLWREKHKNGDEDLRKALWYLTKLLDGEK